LSPRASEDTPADKSAEPGPTVVAAAQRSSLGAVLLSGAEGRAAKAARCGTAGRAQPSERVVLVPEVVGRSAFLGGAR